MFLKCSRIRCVGLALFLAGASASPLCAQESGKKLALLVGIDKCPSGSGISSLPFPGATSTSLPACCWPRAIVPSTSAS